MKSHPYHLHSVLIHDGSPQSGHYYAFIYDHDSGDWKRYNDIRITDVSEDDVFKESLGGCAQMSAYCLVYINEYSKNMLSSKKANLSPSKKANYDDTYIALMKYFETLIP